MFDLEPLSPVRDTWLTFRLPRLTMIRSVDHTAFAVTLTGKVMRIDNISGNDDDEGD